MTDWLPKKTGHSGHDSPRCPWCKTGMYDLTVRWDALSLTFSKYEEDCVTLEASCDCPSCGKPVKVAEVHTPLVMIGDTKPGKTDADERYLAQVGAS